MRYSSLLHDVLLLSALANQASSFVTSTKSSKFLLSSPSPSSFGRESLLLTSAASTTTTSLVRLQASRGSNSGDRRQNQPNSNSNSNDDDISSSAMSNVRKARLAQETSSSNRFALGDELKSLREDLESLRHNLEWARALKDEVRMQSLTKAIKNGQNRDPYFMYAKALRLMAEARKMKDASQEEKDALTDKWSNVADAARQVLPEFNLEGLWVGNYGGKHGTQVVNITYTGDEMIATKCTGDKNVPRGEVTFTVNLEPSNASALPPIQLVSDHRKGEFRRFPGKGQVSRRGFKDHRYVEGQMILFENQFSFVWIPTKHHVLFHRPSPEQTLKLLRNTISKEDEIENMRGHLTRCFDMDLSTAIARQQHAVDLDEPLRRITTQEELEEAEKRVKETNRGNIFYQMSKWRDYIDHVLDNNK